MQITVTLYQQAEGWFRVTGILSLKRGTAMKKTVKSKKTKIKTIKTEIKAKGGRPRKMDKSIAEFVGDIEKDRMTEQEHEIFYKHIDHAVIEKYVREYIPQSSDDEVDNFSYWYGQN